LVVTRLGAAEIAHNAMIARGRLSEARRWFEHRGWKVLPQGIRGQRILSWGAAQAWMASPVNPKRSVRNWCRYWAPWLKETELAALIAATVDTNKRWSADQCAAVLEIGVGDRQIHGFKFIGADDDPNYALRTAIKREKAAARARRYRAGHSTGVKRGRPGLQLSGQDRIARRRAQEAERSKRYRASRQNASRDISNIDGVTGFSVTELSHNEERRAPQARRRLALAGDDDVVVGVGLAPPPRSTGACRRPD
jgi:hypothetical protein